MSGTSREGTVVCDNTPFFCIATNSFVLIIQDMYEFQAPTDADGVSLVSNSPAVRKKIVYASSACTRQQQNEKEMRAHSITSEDDW